MASTEEADKSPINTKEFLQWVTLVQKRQRKHIIRASLVITLFLSSLAWWTYTTSRTSEQLLKSQLADEKWISSMRTVRANAITENEIALCGIVRTLIVRQDIVMSIIVDNAGAIDELYREHIKSITKSHAGLTLANLRTRTARIKQLQAAVASNRLPACGGFPSAPLP